MKIGIDARFYGEAGPGRYAKNIVEHLEKVDHTNTYVIFLRQKGFAAYTPLSENFTKVLADYKWYSWEEQLGFLAKLLKYKLDVLYVPHFNIPVLYPKKIVTAIPDLIMHAFSTEKGTTLFKPYFRFKKFIYRLVVWWAVLRSYKVIVPSLDVKADFRKTFPQIPENKYVLAHEGVDPSFTKPSNLDVTVLTKLGVKEPYLLYVSSMYDHKNVKGLVDAFKIIKTTYNFSGQLVLVGKKDNYSQAIYDYVKTSNLAEWVKLPGIFNYVTDAEVAYLRSKALVYVFPSLKEGFSLTPLESQQVGLPCAISSIRCHKEIYGESVVYFDPQNPDDIAEKVNLLITDTSLRSEIVAQGYENIKKYSWMDNATITAKVFAELAQKP
jgi:glycosyltransferase involved in cell wall biosynthesis